MRLIEFLGKDLKERVKELLERQADEGKKAWKSNQVSAYDRISSLVRPQSEVCRAVHNAIKNLESNIIFIYAGPSSLPSRPQIENRRGALTIRINHDDKEDLAYADSGSCKNIMAESCAQQKGLIIRRRPKDVRVFQVGNGKLVTSIGRARAHVRLVKGFDKPRKEWFHILPNCPAAIILGMPFLEAVRILSKNRHILEECPPKPCAIDLVLWISSPRNRIRCNLDGRNVTAIADSGSDLNLMSLSYAQRGGYRIDRRKEVQRCLEFGDGSQEDTVGEVTVYNLTLNWCEPETAPLGPLETHGEDTCPRFSAVFQVLRDLPSDVILGRDLLCDSDAFNVCPELCNPLETQRTPHTEFNLTISLGLAKDLPLIKEFKRLIRKAQQLPRDVEGVEDKDMHDDATFTHLYQVHEIECKIQKLAKSGHALEVAQKEREKGRMVSDWQNKHRACVFCNPV